jgi:hypothetical protein
MDKKTTKKSQQISNLYRFIRLTIGDAVPDNPTIPRTDNILIISTQHLQTSGVCICRK